MPIFQTNGALHYFAHVPKCAGTSVEDYLDTRFGALAFLDHKHLQNPSTLRADFSAYWSWSRTSPQHIDARSLERLIPSAWFASGFAVVRHPAVRLRSAFRFAQARRDLHYIGFQKWLSKLPRVLAENPYVHDNHARPMSDIVPDWVSAIFRLEDGDRPIVAYLDGLAGNADGARHLPHAQVLRPKKIPKRGLKRIQHKMRHPTVPPLDETLCRLIYDLFPQDYDRFGYAWDDPLQLASSPAAPPKQPDVAKQVSD